VRGGEKKFLIVPAVEPGRGGGHLVRSLRLVQELRSQGAEAYLFSRPSAGVNLPGTEGLLLPPEMGEQSIPWTAIVLDRFQTSPEEFHRWSALGPLVGIDEGGPERGAFDFLIDCLPPPPGFSPANLADPALLFLPKNRRPHFMRIPQPSDGETGPLRVLITLGSEDAQALSVPSALSLARVKGLEVSLLLGPRNPLLTTEDYEDRVVKPLTALGIRILLPQNDLAEHLAEYDLVVTHFGLTAFEAAHARLPVLLVSPTAYHQRLALSRGFYSAGLGRRAAARLNAHLGGFSLDLQRLARIAEKTAAAAPVPAATAASAPVPETASDPETETAPVTEIAPETGDTLSSLIGSFDFVSRARCPLCADRNATASSVLRRLNDRTYRRCGACGMVYMVRPKSPPIQYEERYFFEDYKKQYGKTYLEDFPNLRRMARRRLGVIQGIVQKNGLFPVPPALQVPPGSAPKPSPTPVSGGGQRVPGLLDIGCAYGAFLAEARDWGFDCRGIDPAEDAVSYVVKELRIPAQRGFFPSPDTVRDLPSQGFDVVSLWYVIEHLSDLGEALQGASKILRPRGLLALATPSFSGISGRFRPAAFLRSSPPDHWTLWEPGRTKKILRRYGFALAKIVVTGHHPERFPLLGPLIKEPRGPLYGILYGLSRLFRLGDTFEVYAVKMNEVPHG